MLSDPAAAPNVPPPQPPRHLPRWLKIIGSGCLGVLVCLGAAVGALLASGVLSGPNGNSEIEPAWSPNGRQIAFSSSRDGNEDVFVMDADGTHVKQLTHDPFAVLYFLRSPSDGQPAWSPSGDQIAFVSGRENGMMSYINLRLFVMNADGSDPEEQTSVDPAQAFFPDWSPDGKSVAFNDQFHLYRLDLRSIRPKQLALDLEQAEHPDWSADGDQLVFNALANGVWDVYVVEKDGSQLTRLTDGTGDSGKPRWSPDGTQILFASNRDGDWDIYVMQADGSNVVALTSNDTEDDDPVWSPDGSQVAFASEQDGDWDIFIMDADGANMVQLTGKHD